MPYLVRHDVDAFEMAAFVDGAAAGGGAHSSNGRQTCFLNFFIEKCQFVTCEYVKFMEFYSEKP